MVGERMIHNHTNRERWKKTIHMQRSRSRAFSNGQDFEQDGLGAAALPNAKRAVSTLGAEEQIERTGEDGMVARHEHKILAAERTRPVERNRDSLFRKRWERVGEQVAGLQ